MPRFLDESGLTKLWDKIMTSITTKISKVSETIPVNGGPLASDEVKELFPNGIEKDANLQTILQTLFCKEIYPTATVSSGKLTSQFSQPNISVSNAGGTVEVGTKINVGVFNAYEPGYTATARKYSGFTNGYSLADDDSADASTNPPEVELIDITMNTGTYTLTRTYTNFGCILNEDEEEFINISTKSGTDYRNISIPAEDREIYVNEGNNSIEFEISGPGHRGKVPASPEYYIVSNLGNTDSEPSKKIEAQGEQNLSNANAAPSTKTYTITGVYKYFLGYSSNTEFSQFNSESIRALSAKIGDLSSITNVVGSTPISSNGSSIVIACPNMYELKTITNSLGADIKPNFSSVGDVSVTTGAIQTQYTVYVYPITNGTVIEYKNLTIGKK